MNGETEAAKALLGFSTSFSPIAKRILNEHVIRIIPYSLQGTAPATAANYGNMFIAFQGFKLIGVSAVWRTAAGGGTLDIEKCANGVAPDSGVALLRTTIDLTATANTPIFATLTGQKSDLLLRRSDRLVAKDASLSGSPADLFVQLALLQI